MNSSRDSDRDGCKESTIRRPVPKYQHYIDHFEELYRQSPLAKVVVQDGHSTPSSKYAISNNTPSSFKVPGVSSMPRPKPVPASVGAFIMSPVAKLIQQMQSSEEATQKDSDKSTGHVETSPQERAQNGDWQDVEDASQKEQGLVSGGGPTDFKPGQGQETESSKAAEAVVEEEAAEEDNDSLLSDIPSVVDVAGEMDVETERIQEVEDAQMKGPDPDLCIKLTIKESSLGTVPQPKERRWSARIKDVAVKSASDAEQSNGGSCDDLTKLSMKTVTDLDQWIIKWLGSGLKHLAVEGHRLEDPEGSFWHSTAIFKRISPFLVETSSGSRYHLHGNINKLLAVDHGFSRKFLRRFQHGFPAGWKAYLVEEAMEQSGKKVAEAVAESQDTDTAKTSNTTGINQRKYTKHKTHNKNRKKGKMLAEKKTPGVQAPMKVPETTPVTRKKDTAVVTPSFVSMDEIRTTKSGRKVLPPLQFWRGQRQRTLLYMGGAAELLEGSVDCTPVSATSRSLKGSIDISQRARRYHTREETPCCKKRQVKSKRTTSDRDSSVQESESEDKVPERKKAANAQTERSVNTSATLKGDGKECILEALSCDLVQGSLRRSPRKSLNDSEHHHSRDRSGSTSQTGVHAASDLSPTVSGGRRDAAKIRNPYDLHSAVMGVVKQHHQRRKSNQSKRRHSREASLSSPSAPGQKRVEDSFNISDDEEFKNDSSTSATEEREENSSLSRKGHPVLSKSNKTTTKHKRKGSSKVNEKVLLGSNMLPSVVLEDYNDNDFKVRMKKKDSSGAGKQDKLEQNGSKKTKETRQSRRSERNKKSPQQVETDQEQNKNEKWKPDELDRLHRALKMIPPSSKQFWHRVASSVGTRTEWECQQAHQAKLEMATKASNQSKATTKDNKDSNLVAKEPVVLTAAKGTMRRKRQLRELIQQHNQASEEDLFESTPFKKQRKTTVPLLNLDLQEEEEDSEGMLAKTPGSARLKTPSTRFHNLLAPLSGKKTPHSTTFSPGLLYSVEKKHMDKYIYGMQKKRAGRRMKKIPETALEVSPPLKVRPKQLRTRTMAVTPSVSEAFQIHPVQDQDSDFEGDEDYYWSDEENNAAPSTR